MRTGCYKRKDNRWEAYVVYTDPDTGLERKKSFYGDTGLRTDRKQKADAEKKRDSFIDKIEAGDYSDVKKITVAGWLKKYLTVYCASKAQTTIDGYRTYIEGHIIPAIGNHKLAGLKPIHLQQFYNSEREKNYSGKTILQEHHILHRAFRKAVADGLIARNPCNGVDPPQLEDFKPAIYTEKQYKTLLDKLKGHKMEVVILLAGMCGLRRGELLGLTWNDIDLKAGVVNIERSIVATSKGPETKSPKSKTSVRTVAIPDAILPRLRELRRIGKIYAREDGKDYHPGSLSKRFSDFLKVNKLPHMRLHDLRHFNATMMLRHGVTEREASARLGHSDLLMTKKYQHIVQDMDKMSANKLNKIFDG